MLIHNIAKNSAKKFPKHLLLIVGFLCIVSCYQGKVDPFDREAGLSLGDIKKALIKDKKEDKKNKEQAIKNQAPIPNISMMISPPLPPTIGGDKKISFSINESVSLKDALIELGRVADIDIDIDPKISGGIIVNATNRPLKEVIDRIATLGNLRYTYKNKVLYFEADVPYMKNYFVDYLYDGTLWGEVENNISAILSSFDPGKGSSTSTATPAASTTSTDSSSSSSSFSSNKSAGIISVYATNKEHEAITKYLADVQKQASAQVLIEAKVVEVQLKDEFRAGIDWSQDKFKGNFSAVSGNTSGVVAGSDPFTLAASLKLFGTSLGFSSIKLLEQFGVTKTLSSPRINAMNNQKATISFVDKFIYFKVTATQTATAGSTGTGAVPISTTITSEKNEADIGISLAITPSINIQKNEIVMTILPKLSIKTGEVRDPAGAGDIKYDNIVPIIQSRELSTVAKVQSGNVLVIGGLMKVDSSNGDIGVPLLNRIPILGWLFKSINKNNTVTETVIFIKATIVGTDSVANKVDREIQEKFDINKRRYFE